jgi:Na+-transporting NADH:ubiquinone oxidoreductase subunit C
MNINANRFIFIFSTIMVIVVATLLSLASIGLAPYQSKNVMHEKMQNILSSVGVEAKADQAEAAYDKYITGQLVLNTRGEVVDSGQAAFNIDLKKEMDKVRFGQADKQLFPLFVCTKEGKSFFIIPVRGKGLWGPIWGYMALEQDMNTVHGISFGHKSETPGLGAEIETEKFRQQFTGKKIMDETGNFVSVKVIKGGAEAGNTHEVDAVSGATVTSNGVSEMLQRTLKSYIPYFKSVLSKG